MNGMTKVVAAAAVAGGVLGLSISSANAATVFYNNLASFTAASTTTLVDFEGIAPDNGFSTTNPLVADGVTFIGVGSTLAVSGANSALDGNPFKSAFLTQNGGVDQINVDLSTAGSGYTAIGGVFGDQNSVGTQTTIRLVGTSGILDTQVVILGSNQVGQNDTFFGWISDGTDEIIGIEFVTDFDFGTIDDVRFGTAAVVPLPAALPLLLSALGVFGFFGWRRRQTATA